MELGLRIIFSICFGLLLFARIHSFEESYLKFAMLDFIGNNHLAFLFYLFGFIEFILTFCIFLSNSKWIKIVMDVGLLIYVPWIILYYMILLRDSNGCIECNYTTHFLGEHIIITGIGLILLSVLYAFYLREKMENPANSRRKEL